MAARHVAFFPGAVRFFPACGKAAAFSGSAAFDAGRAMRRLYECGTARRWSASERIVKRIPHVGARRTLNDDTQIFRLV